MVPLESTDHSDHEEYEKSKVTKVPVNSEKYLRPVSGAKKAIKKTKDKKLRGELSKADKKFKDAADSAARAEVLLTESAGFLQTEHEMERTFKVTQEDIKKQANVHTASKIFELQLDTFGPYCVDYTRNGRHVLLGGRKGHIALMDTLRMGLVTEFFVEETVHSVRFLHNYTMFAVAQKKYTYIYDHTGAEVHCLRDLKMPTHLEFLPYHFLLACVGKGTLSYLDTSTGKMIAQHATKIFSCESMVQNRWNGVIHVGDARGMVSMFTPNMAKAVVKIQCHQGPVKAIAIDATGKFMVTSGLDRAVKVWDLTTYQLLQSYFVKYPATSLDISQRGLIAMGFGSHVQVLKDALQSKSSCPYMEEFLPTKQITDVKFQPFEDVLCVGHSKGLRNMVIPGAGEPNIDTFAANPFEDKKQRRETEVRNLLEKLQPEMITLNPMAVGRIDQVPEEERNEKIRRQELANNRNKPVVGKKKARGRNKIANKLRKKQKNVVDMERHKYRSQLDAKKNVKENDSLQSPSAAFDRFL